MASDGGCIAAGRIGAEAGVADHRQHLARLFLHRRRLAGGW